MKKLHLMLLPLTMLGLSAAAGEYVSRDFLPAETFCRVKAETLVTRDPVKPDQTLRVWYHRYVPRSVTAKGTLIIHPPTGGVTPLDKNYATMFCRNGVPVALLDAWDGYLESVDDFGTHDRAALRAIAATKAVIDRLRVPVALLGESLGAIYSSSVMGRDQRVRAAVLIVGGAPVVDVLMDTDQVIPASQRQRRMKQWKLTSEQYRQKLVENVRVSPDDHANPLRRDDLFMVIAEQDTTVPTDTQWSLWKSWGEPSKVARFKTDHVGAIKKAFFEKRKKMLAFIQEKLK